MFVLLRKTRIIRLILAAFALFAFLMFGLLALFVVPAPAANTAVEINGVISSISAPPRNTVISASSSKVDALFTSTGPMRSQPLIGKRCWPKYNPVMRSG